MYVGSKLCGQSVPRGRRAGEWDRSRRRRPATLHADKGYDNDHLRRWLRKRGIRHRIACKGIESSTRLGRHRWVVERTVSWLAGCRRLHRRYERKPEHFLAFVGIAATLICHRRLTK
ncbi:Transposase DDE domain-containing protein [Streptomyces sp. Ncost-T10-10d]|nr:Transposase DDE domain-containing protein [Streptomyces sp. Ncost-T10-10d]